MNVKPGDMAVVVGEHQARNAVVEVLAAASADDIKRMQALCNDWTVQTVWKVKGTVFGKGFLLDGTATSFVPGDIAFIADKFLRRIDPKRDPAYDETTLVACEPAVYHGVIPLKTNAL